MTPREFVLAVSFPMVSAGRAITTGPVSIPALGTAAMLTVTGKNAHIHVRGFLAFGSNVTLVCSGSDGDYCEPTVIPTTDPTPGQSRTMVSAALIIVIIHASVPSPSPVAVSIDTGECPQ